MEYSPSRVLAALGICCAMLQLHGCSPMTGRLPGGYPASPIGITTPQPYPGGSPWYPVNYPGFPGNGPGIPIVLNPGPRPIPFPQPPITPIPDPGSKPDTIPVSDPKPNPADPADDPSVFWRPWPLPPRGNPNALRSVSDTSDDTESYAGEVRPLKSQTSRGSRSSERHRSVAGIPGSQIHDTQLVEGANPTPRQDLKYRGGRTIRNLSWVNLYISGDTAWDEADVRQIDHSLTAAMRDEHLNNVLLQYYGNQPITSVPLASHPLIGYTPKTVTRGDIQNYVTYLYQHGYLKPYDLQNTVFNFLLPPGSILTDDNDAANAHHDEPAESFTGTETHNIVPESEEGDSLTGLGGYHGSVVISGGGRIYYSADVYSQRLPDGSANGIPVFPEPWKNVVATLYHELVEARTDPDVEDAIRNPNDPNSDRYLGWISDEGEEIGDFPLHDNVPITSIVREVPLADGSGTVPIQLQYSNAVHGPEGPIPHPYPLGSR